MLLTDIRKLKDLVGFKISQIKFGKELFRQTSGKLTKVKNDTILLEIKNCDVNSLKEPEYFCFLTGCGHESVVIKDIVGDLNDIINTQILCISSSFCTFGHRYSEDDEEEEKLTEGLEEKLKSRWKRPAELSDWEFQETYNDFWHNFLQISTIKGSVTIVFEDRDADSYYYTTDVVFEYNVDKNLFVEDKEHYLKGVYPDELKNFLKDNLNKQGE